MDTETWKKGVGQRVKSRREELGMRIEEVAFRARCSSRTVWGLEAGESIGHLDIIVRIAEVTGTSLNWFVWGLEPKELRVGMTSNATC